jgi:hypothetical protein
MLGGKQTEVDGSLGARRVVSMWRGGQLGRHAGVGTLPVI